MDAMFREIIKHIKVYVLDVLKFKDMLIIVLQKLGFQELDVKIKFNGIFTHVVMFHLFII